ncbi:MAG TPA: protein phosphatase 2C domain-containing protein [Gammaproteobacteria bacterium]|nr:protein phosphatase 2C domain-containing protein [Gammaproteobacteria bacterium]
MRVDHAKLTLPGHRTENQDRLDVVVGSEALLLIVVDGMGGHAHGARAAEVTVTTLKEAFAEVAQPVFDPQGFLTLSLARAHDRVVKLGDGVALDHKPRATCAVCLVQDGGAYWAHVGDSRIYLLRGGAIKTRTRDHSHVELLLREGLIAESEMRSHPMRNFVECCLGGDVPLPDMSVTARNKLEPGDVLLLCTDGLWSGVEDSDFGNASRDERTPIESMVRSLAERAVANNAPHSDNTSVAAARWLGS